MDARPRIHHEERVSYTGTQVYYPPSTTLDMIRDVLMSRFPEATLSVGRGGLTIAFGATQVIDISLDAAEHVPEEARWLGESADAVTRRALDEATYRVEIFPKDPSADPDDMYDELLGVFEALHGMPGAVGADPFDGALYRNGAKAPKP